MTLHEQYPDARQFLESVRTSRAAAMRCARQTRELRAQVESITAPLNSSPVINGSKDVHGDARLAALTDLQDRLTAASDDWLRRVKEAEDFVDRIGNVEHRILLQLRYIDCNRWDDVQRIMERFGLYYSNRQMFRLHGNALQEARRLWNEESEAG